MKKVILILCLFLPVFINAACDRDLQSTYSSYAEDISYETDFSLSQKKYTVILYNVIDDMKVVYNKKTYTTKNGEIKIENISQGTNMEIQIYGKDGCSEAARIIYINQPYYNEYFGSTVCSGYENKITYCTHQFTSNSVTLDLVETAIDNYNSSIAPYEEKEAVELTFREKVINFLETWVVKVLLFMLSAIITNAICYDKYIKVKHKL